MSKCFQPIFIVLIIQQVTCMWIYIENDGPVTFDTPITFTVHNTYPSIAPSYEYRFNFPQFPNQNRIVTSQSNHANLPVIFKSSQAPIADFYRVDVDVWYRFFGIPWYTVGNASSTFLLSDSLIGQIQVKQENIPSSAIEKHLISTELPVNLSASIHDPSNFFSTANITYKWILNGVPEEEGTDQTISVNFTVPQINNISVIVSASLTENTESAIQKSGSFATFITSKEPLHNLTADGKTYVHRDENLQLKVNFVGGSSPYWYCWTIKNVTNSNETGSSLDEPVCRQTNDSYFSITRYFNRKGKYNFTTQVGNNISSLAKNWTILIYEIEHHGQLSFVLIPVCSILLAIFIIIGGIAIHMRQRKELSIEVADFDFQSYDDLVERTFFERIRDNFNQTLKNSFLRPCARRNEYDDFVNDQSVNHDDLMSSPDPVISECNLRFSGDFNDSGVSGDVRT